jgi:transcriptional regulator with XRE-family HTH domain
MPTNLIDEIKKLQQLKGLSDQKFSKAIGMDPGSWSRIKRGLVPPGGKFLTAVIQNFPELRLAVHEHMITGGEKAAVQ